VAAIGINSRIDHQSLNDVGVSFLSYTVKNCQLAVAILCCRCPLAAAAGYSVTVSPFVTPSIMLCAAGLQLSRRERYNILHGPGSQPTSCCYKGNNY